jgi:A/G-specific adenine glycosylase
MARVPLAAKLRVRRQTATTAVGIPSGDWPAFRQRLLSWFRRNKRDLPWRHSARGKRDPYRVWLSEIMLQQTRVAAAIPFYERFLQTFPTVRHLARAREASVLGAWAGLGYYSRARNLHRTAKEIVVCHDGIFPREHAVALQLPGIGRYTSAAILSIAYQQPLAALDGNVARVLARLGAVRGDLRQPNTWKRLDDAAGALLARQTPGDWNEAMMELGATVCTPMSPRCAECPVARWCRAHSLGIADRLPAARRKAGPVKITVAAAVLLDPRGRTLLVRRPNGDGAIFARLWQFPAAEARNDSSEALRHHLAEIMGMRSSPDPATPDTVLQPLTPARHSVTFRDVRLLPFLVRVSRLPSVKGAQTPPLASLNRLPISNATRKIADAALAALQTPE